MVSRYQYDEIREILQFIKELQTLDDWSFDVFALSESGTSQPIKYLGYDLLNRYGIFHKFKVPPSTLENFLVRIEEGYCRHRNPYHNNLHAADVAQTIHFMLCQTGLMNWLTDLEIFATLVAALIHDYEHTGTTNNFHVMAGTDTAMLYNDRAVLENHHVSASFRVLKEDDCNILQNLSKEEFREFRTLVIDMVLATDMSFHFQQLKNMRNLLTLAEPSVDKSKALSLVLHCCDIAHPSKRWDLHHRWTSLLLEEFFRQGDKERELGLPFSPLCDRNNTLVAESQIGFIEFIVEPSMAVCSDMLETILGPINAPTPADVAPISISEQTDSSKAKDGLNLNCDVQAMKYSIPKPWVGCLLENKKRWKEQALKDAESRAATQNDSDSPSSPQHCFIEFIVEPSMAVCSDMLETILGPINAPTPADVAPISISEQTDSSKAKDGLNLNCDVQAMKYSIPKPWVGCLLENKKRWKEQALKGKQKLYILYFVM
ncbi:calcium/calmodulin-dependent 3',5'-cyclic nucleotide phosphodiesterase 1 [Diaphorina citri]|uniref:Phosphodiesterase n=1 Tax=Diaphorina citri TaxID=121845 RepID=A0A1S3D6T0_DIACI|nr:calcium/calmodulin-dependent 3',5'-cyclic nucleotide phosphodiesterase 1 [Diaphorina citri]